MAHLSSKSDAYSIGGWCFVGPLKGAKPTCTEISYKEESINFPFLLALNEETFSRIILACWKTSNEVINEGEINQLVGITESVRGCLKCGSQGRGQVHHEGSCC